MRVYQLACLSLILTLICYLHPAFGFEYQRSRWRLAELPIPCYLSTSSIPEDLAVADVEQAVIQSLEAWNRAAGIRIFEYAGRIQLEAVLADDGWNAISFVSTDWLKATDGLPVGITNAGATCTWSVSDPIGSPPQHGVVKIDFLRAFDIVINAEVFQWTVGAKPNHYDVQSVITHELGHVLSLGHSDDDPRAPDAPTMVERMYSNDTKLRTLEADDIAGVQSIYRKVSGALRADAHWENMIWIDGDVIVPRGVSLKIATSIPQTVVHFSPASRLIVEGELTVDVAFSRQILFTGIDGAQWGGLEIHSTAQVRQIADCIFEGATVALAFLSASDVSVRSCEFRRSQTAVQVVDGQQITISGVFHQNRVGAEIQSSRKIEVIESVLTQNDIGVRLIDTEAQIRSSNLMENTIGVEIRSDQPILLRESNITNNKIGVRIVGGIADLGRAPGDPGRNNLFGNTVWNLALEAPPPAPIFAQGNYWGELTVAGIDQTIRDDDEVANLPPVRYEPTLDRISQTELKIEIVDIAPAQYFSTEGLMDRWTVKSSRFDNPQIDGRRFGEYLVLDENGNERTITTISAQAGFLESSCVWPIYLTHFRVVNLSTRTADAFTVQFYLSPDAKQEPNPDFRVAEYHGPIQRLGTGEDRSYEAYFRFPDLPIDGISQAFYLWPRIVFEGTGESLNLSGKWIEIYEELADLVGTVHEIPASALPGEEINVRYSIKNYGRKQEGSQTVRFYLSKTWERFKPPQPDYLLLPEIKLPELEGEWTSQLTIPADVPVGEYYLWMLVDANNDVIECDSDNNPATYLANPIRIGDFDEAEQPRAVQPHGKRPIVWGALKTALFQNFPNPFNPETWIPYQLAGETSVHITIYSAQGQLVRRIDLGILPAGRYIDKGRAAYWDGRNEIGESVSSGIYWYQLRTADSQSTKRMVIRK
ncbi:matrixin family metalloprotease [Candidatus Poribacteria bacterium]|nr:matrixin family metalloprotease [Candidatus Poribacteria bacterium]